MSRIFHLSFLLDLVGNNRIDLVSFYELSKLDEFIIKRFRNTKDVRKKYNDDIGEFCLNNIDFIKRENKKNKRDWLGSVVIIEDVRDAKDNTTELHKIAVIYKNDKQLLSKENCLSKIKEKLKNKNVVKEIFENKRYLLSEYEIDLLYKHFSRTDDKYLKSFVGNFYNRLKRIENDELLYYYCRSLMNICKLNELSLQTDFGTIDHINYEIPHAIKMIKDKPLSGDCYFNDLINSENYEELFQMYDIDDIDREINYWKKGRTKK